MDDLSIKDSPIDTDTITGLIDLILTHDKEGLQTTNPMQARQRWTVHLLREKATTPTS